MGAFLPKSDVKTNPSIEINKKERKVTKFPHPGSDLTSSSRKITLRLHPTNTVKIASFTLRLVPCFSDSVEDFMFEEINVINNSARLEPYISCYVI